MPPSATSPAFMRNRLSVMSFVLALLTVSREAGAASDAKAEPPEEPSILLAPPAEKDRSDEPDASEHAWEDQDHLRAGLLLGVGFPRPLAIQGLVKIERALGLGFEAGMMPPLKIGPLEGSFWGVAGDLRIFPFQGAFFLGLRAGYQRMKATATANVPVVGTLTESAIAETWFVNPRVGFLWTLQSGLTIGLDVGVQVPIKKSFVDTLPEGTPADVRSSMQDVANTFGHAVSPTVDLLRIGFLF